MRRYFAKSSFNQRAKAGCVFVFLAAGFVFLWMGAFGRIDLDYWIDPCGFKQDYGLPCPTCYMTTSALAFVRGDLLKSFYVQPAGGFFCTAALIVLFLSFIEAVFGVYSTVFRRFFREIRIRHMLLAFFVVLAAGWAVTLSRAFAAGSGSL